MTIRLIQSSADIIKTVVVQASKPIKKPLVQTSNTCAGRQSWGSIVAQGYISKTWVPQGLKGLQEFIKAYDIVFVMRLLVVVALLVLVAGCMDSQLRQQRLDDCAAIQNVTFKDDCYRSAGMVLKDPAVCDNIQDQRLKDWCKWEANR
jgi:hypothetical protein